MAPGSINIKSFRLIWHLVATARASWLPPPPNTLECGAIFFTQIILNSKIISKLSFSNHHDLQESCRQQTCHPSSFPQVPAVTKIYPYDSKDLKTKIPKTNPYDSSKGQISYHSELILLCKKTISPFLKMNPSRIGKSYHQLARVIFHRQELSSIGKSYHS